jgi:uncharacterized membrane protein
MISTYKTQIGKKKRIFEIDFVRGFCILLMVMDHFFYDWGYLIKDIFNYNELNVSWIDSLSNFAGNYWNWSVRVIVRVIVVALFLITSGVSSTLSKNNLKRGLMIFGVGLLMDIGFFAYSKIANADNYVFFGAISCIGTCILIYSLYDFLFKKIDKNKKIMPFVSLAIGLIIILIGHLVICPRYPYAPVLSSNNLNWTNWWQPIIGFKYFGDDWLPLFPFLGYFFLGAGIGGLLYRKKKSIFSYIEPKVKYYYPNRLSMADDFFTNRVVYEITRPGYYLLKGISWFGQYTMWVYLFHQVVWIILISIIMLCSGYTFNF